MIKDGPTLSATTGRSVSRLNQVGARMAWASRGSGGAVGGKGRILDADNATVVKQGGAQGIATLTWFPGKAEVADARAPDSTGDAGNTIAREAAVEDANLAIPGIVDSRARAGAAGAAIASRAAVAAVEARSSFPSHTAGGGVRQKNTIGDGQLSAVIKYRASQADPGAMTGLAGFGGRGPDTTRHLVIGEDAPLQGNNSAAVIDARSERGFSVLASLAVRADHSPTSQGQVSQGQADACFHDEEVAEVGHRVAGEDNGVPCAVDHRIL